MFFPLGADIVATAVPVADADAIAWMRVLTVDPATEGRVVEATKVRMEGFCP